MRSAFRFRINCSSLAANYYYIIILWLRRNFPPDIRFAWDDAKYTSKTPTVLTVVYILYYKTIASLSYGPRIGNAPGWTRAHYIILCFMYTYYMYSLSSNTYARVQPFPRVTVRMIWCTLKTCADDQQPSQTPSTQKTFRGLMILGLGARPGWIGFFPYPSGDINNNNYYYAGSV